MPPSAPVAAASPSPYGAKHGGPGAPGTRCFPILSQFTVFEMQPRVGQGQVVGAIKAGIGAASSARPRVVPWQRRARPDPARLLQTLRSSRQPFKRGRSPKLVL